MLFLLIPGVAFPLLLGWNMFTTMAIGFALLGVYRAWTMRVVLSGDLLRSQDLFFRRRIQRKEILRVGEERIGAVRRTFVTTQKRMYYLPVPIDGRLAHNPNFDEHYAIVEDWWKGRRPRVPSERPPA